MRAETAAGKGYPPVFMGCYLMIWVMYKDTKMHSTLDTISAPNPSY